MHRHVHVESEIAWIRQILALTSNEPQWKILASTTHQADGGGCGSLMHVHTVWSCPKRHFQYSSLWLPTAIYLVVCWVLILMMFTYHILKLTAFEAKDGNKTKQTITTGNPCDTPVVALKLPFYLFAQTFHTNYQFALLQSRLTLGVSGRDVFHSCYESKYVLI